MKTKLIPSILLCAALCSCTTTPTGQRVLDPQKTATAIRAVVPAAVVIAVQKEPKSRAYFAATVAVIEILEAQGPVSPQALQASLAQIGVKELRTDEAQLAIAAALGIYSAYWGEVVAAKLDTTIATKPILDALKESIMLGLQ